MLDGFWDIAWITSVGAAFVSVVSALLEVSYSISERKRKVREAIAANFEAILKSDNLKELGKYLDETLGQFDVAEYVAKDDVSSRIDRYIAKLKDYIGTSEEISEEERVPVPPREERPESPAGVFDLFEPPYNEILAEFETGERWNALARLRRHIEIELRELGIEMGFSEDQLRSAGQILHLLSTSGRVNQGPADQLRYAVSVCNRAIHGRDVSEGEAQEALWVAQRAMQHLRINDVPGAPQR